MGRGTKADRLKRARQMEGYKSASEAARVMGVATPTYIHHENGNRDFTEDAAAIYAAKFHVNLSWLLLGEGNMYSDEAEAARQSENRKDLSRAESGRHPLIRDQSELAQELARTINFIPEIYSKGEHRSLPVSDSWWHRPVPGDAHVVHEVARHWGIPADFLADIGCRLGSTVIIEHRGGSLEPRASNGDVFIINTNVRMVIADGLYLISDASRVVGIKWCRRNIGTDTISVGVEGRPHEMQTIAEADILIAGLVSALLTRRI